MPSPPATTPAAVFLSYAREDSDAARRMADAWPDEPLGDPSSSNDGDARVPSRRRTFTPAQTQAGRIER